MENATKNRGWTETSALGFLRCGYDNGTLTRAQVNAAIKAGNLTPSVLSAVGVKFIRSAKPGETMTGRDGSVWVKGEDGTTIITTPDGKSYFVR